MVIILKKIINFFSDTWRREGAIYFFFFFFIFESKTYPLVIFLPCEAIQNKSVFWVTTLQTKNLYCPVLFISITLDKISYLSIIFNHSYMKSWHLQVLFLASPPSNLTAWEYSGRMLVVSDAWLLCLCVPTKQSADWSQGK